MRIPFLSRLRAEPQSAVAEPKAAVPGQGGYTSAQRIDSAITHWQPSTQSADGAILPAKDLTDARTADLDRNDPYVAGMINLKRNAVAGYAYLLNAKPIYEGLGDGFDEAWQEAFQIEVETKFNAYLSSPNRFVDAARIRSGVDIISAGIASFLVNGEVLMTSEYISGGGRPFRTAVQLIDPARLSTPDDRTTDPRIRAGVERDHYGGPIAYHIQTRHPADFDMANPTRTWKRIPARKPWGRPNVLHIFDAARPDQTRGISMLAPAVRHMRMSHLYDTTRLNNARARSRILQYLRSSVPEKLLEALGVSGATHADTPGSGIMDQYLEMRDAAFGDSMEFAKAGRFNIVDDVRIPILPPGTEFEQVDPTGNGAFGPEFEASLARKQAAAAGMSYESYTRDLSHANYSSLRAGRIPEQQANNQLKQQVSDPIANFIYRNWLEEAILTGKIKALPAHARSLQWLYSGTNFDMIAAAEWISAAKGSIDELKEDQAAILRLNNNMTTLEQECAMRGLDYRSVLNQRAREHKLKEQLGLGDNETSTAKSEAALTKNPKEDLEIEGDK